MMNIKRRSPPVALKQIQKCCARDSYPTKSGAWAFSHRRCRRKLTPKNMITGRSLCRRESSIVALQNFLPVASSVCRFIERMRLPEGIHDLWMLRVECEMLGDVASGQTSNRFHTYATFRSFRCALDAVVSRG